MNSHKKRVSLFPKQVMMTALMAVIAGLGLAPTAARCDSLRVGIYQNSPKVFWEKDGKPQGLFIDIMNQIAKSEGWKIDYVPGTWNENLDRLERNELELVVDVTYSEERAQRFLFNKIPVIESWLQAFTIKPFKFEGIMDLNHKNIGVLKGGIQEKYLLELKEKFGLNFTLKTYPDYSGSVQALRKGEADVLIASRFFYFSELRTDNIHPTSIVMHPASVYFAFSKNHNERLITIIDKNLSDMKNNPGSAYYRSMYHWLGMRPRLVIPVYIKWLLAALTGLLLLTILLWQAQRWHFYKRHYQLELEKQTLIKHYDYLTLYTNDMVILSDQDSNIVETNHKAEQTYGYARREFLQLKTGDLWGGGPRQDIESERNGILYETVHKRKDGDLFPVEVSARCIEIEGRRYIQEIIRDISERRRAEETMKKQLSDLQLWQTTMMGREDRVMELKKEINKLLEKMGQPKRYGG